MSCSRRFLQAETAARQIEQARLPHVRRSTHCAHPTSTSTIGGIADFPRLTSHVCRRSAVHPDPFAPRATAISSDSGPEAKAGGAWSRRGTLARIRVSLNPSVPRRSGADAGHPRARRGSCIDAGHRWVFALRRRGPTVSAAPSMAGSGCPFVMRAEEAVVVAATNCATTGPNRRTPSTPRPDLLITARSRPLSACSRYGLARPPQLGAGSQLAKFKSLRRKES